MNDRGTRTDVPVILVTGANGQVGYELVRALAPLGTVSAPSSAELDITDARAVASTIAHLRPRVVVNAAAYTAVDRAEGDRARCFAVNEDGAGNLARAAAAGDALIVHYSTDYVFDGRASIPYDEESPTGPASVYGASKLAGELAVAAAGRAHIILRTSWVYGVRGSNFVRTIRRLAREREVLRVVNDQMGAPTWSRMIADGTALLIAQLLAADAPRDVAEVSGTYHMAAGGCTSWFAFANAIVEHFRERESVACTSVLPVTTEEYGALAPRPAYSCLDSGKLRRVFGITLPSWQHQLALALQDFPAA